MQSLSLGRPTTSGGWLGALTCHTHPLIAVFWREIQISTVEFAQLVLSTRP